MAPDLLLAKLAALSSFNLRPSRAGNGVMSVCHCSPSSLLAVTARRFPILLISGGVDFPREINLERKHTLAFKECTFKDKFGATVICSRLLAAIDRQGMERRLMPGIQVGLVGWQRSHSQGAGTGHESPLAIRYAPEDVNQAFQRLGIERYLRELFELKPPEVDLWLTTTTETHPMTLRLKEIQYRVDAARGGESRRIFEASIEIANERVHPRITVNATPYHKTF